MSAGAFTRSALASLAALGIGVLSSCAEPTVDISLSDPCHLLPGDLACDLPEPTAEERGLCETLYCRGTADSVQLAVFRGECPANSVLDAGDLKAAESFYTVPVGDPLPALGNLPAENFGFAVLLRDKYCNVIGWDCKQGNLAKTRQFPLSIIPTGGNQGACTAPEECVNGTCGRRPPGWGPGT